MSQYGYDPRFVQHQGYNDQPQYGYHHDPHYGTESHVSGDQHLNDPRQYQYQDAAGGGTYQEGTQHQHQPGTMAGDPQRPQLGATFYPGGHDDFYMPEVVSPVPQRIMPEVPSNMQEGVAKIELEARNPSRVSSQSTVSSIQSPLQNPYNRDPPQSIISQGQSSGPSFTASYSHTNAAAYQNLNRASVYMINGLGHDSPKFSPFPKLRDAGNNVPLSDEEKEEVLERARPLVLKSTDPEMQLAWAQDALTWVEVSQSTNLRPHVNGQPARSITPKVEHTLRVDAISIVTFLAEQHHPKAEFMKGMWLEFGKFGYRVDKMEAYQAYRRAADRGYARAEYRLGMQFESSNNSPKAIEHYKRGVAMKDSASNYRLGMMTLLGQHDTPQDYQKGIDLIRYAADTADENAPQGAYVYGMLLARELPNINLPDKFLPYDLNDAMVFIEKAAYLGFARAQLKMAQAYELCQLGCEFDPALSLHYNSLASRQGEAEADMAISKWFLCGFEGIFEKNEELAFTYAKRAAQTKMATAEFAMGYFYEIGMYVPIDLQESEAWYGKAADHGNKDALGRIKSIKENKLLSKKDHEQVAISRIKSQYGSQRGGRPDRLKQRPTPMAAMQEDQVDMPDPRNSYAGPQPQLRVQSNIQPPRPVSTAPYPEDDMAALTMNSTYQNKSLRPASAVGPHADRPSSAFGIRSLHHQPIVEPPYERQPRAAESQRPSSSMGNMSVPNGRGNSPAGRDRVVSAGVATGSYSAGAVSAGWEPQLTPKFPESSLNRPPTVPFLPLRADKAPATLQKQQPSNVNKPQPPQPPSQLPYLSEPVRKPLPQLRTESPSSVPRRDAALNQFQRPERGSSMTPITPATGPPNQRPERYDSFHSSAASSMGSRASQRPQQTMSSRTDGYPAGQQTPQAMPSGYPSSGQPAPKKTGPATFEEMGIPAGKNDSECNIM